MKTIVSIVLILVVLGGLMWWGRMGETSTELSTGPSILVTDKTLHDFGTISMRGGTVDAFFDISNPSAEELRLTSIVTSCMCTTAYIADGEGEKGPFGMPGHGGPVARANVDFKPGESRRLRVVYDPNAHGPAGVGKIDRFVLLTDSSGRELQLEIKTTVTP